MTSRLSQNGLPATQPLSIGSPLNSCSHLSRTINTRLPEEKLLALIGA